MCILERSLKITSVFHLFALQIFTEHVNYIKVDNMKKDFDSQMLICPPDDLQQAHFIMNSVIDRARNSLKGKSGPLFLAQLTKVRLSAVSEILL